MVNAIGNYNVSFSNTPMNWMVHFVAVKGSSP
jgi:hypothetical protein